MDKRINMKKKVMIYKKKLKNNIINFKKKKFTNYLRISFIFPLNFINLN
jgi:hypothetical protein